MSRAATLSSIRRQAMLAAWLSALALGLMTRSARAQESSPSSIPASTGSDPTLVVARTVKPRIAYRGLAPQDNPVRSQVTVFPTRAFDRAISGALGRVLSDDALGERGSAGIAVVSPAVPTPAGMRLPQRAGDALAAGGAAARSPLGNGPGVGNAVVGATAGLSALITRSVLAMRPGKP